MVPIFLTSATASGIALLIIFAYIMQAVDVTQVQAEHVPQPVDAAGDGHHHRPVPAGRRDPHDLLADVGQAGPHGADDRSSSPAATRGRSCPVLILGFGAFALLARRKTRHLPAIQITASAMYVVAIFLKRYALMAMGFVARPARPTDPDLLPEPGRGVDRLGTPGLGPAHRDAGGQGAAARGSRRGARSRACRGARVGYGSATRRACSRDRGRVAVSAEERTRPRGVLSRVPAWAWAVAGVVVVLAIAVGVALYATSRPAFFAGYHSLDRSYTTLQSSAHKNLRCSQCHTDPRGPVVYELSLVGDFYRGLFGKPKSLTFVKLPKPSREACLSCHAYALGVGRQADDQGSAPRASAHHRRASGLRHLPQVDCARRDLHARSTRRCRSAPYAPRSVATWGRRRQRSAAAATTRFTKARVTGSSCTARRCKPSGPTAASSRATTPISVGSATRRACVRRSTVAA